MSYGRYYKRRRRTFWGSYVEGLDLLGFSARRSLGAYSRNDSRAIADAWTTTGKAIKKAMKNYSQSETGHA